MIRVPYKSQRDNANKPATTCNVTCVAMILEFAGARSPGGQLEDALFARITSPEGEEALRTLAPWAVGRAAPWTVHAMLVWVAAEWGRSLSFATTRTWPQIDRELAAGRPVILAGRFTGPGGHLVVLVGRTADGYVVHDPWGDWTTGYADRDGEARTYPAARLVDVTARDGAVWAHFLVLPETE